MKRSINLTRQLVALLVLAFSGSAFAAGSHAGDGAHGHEESAIGQPGLAKRVNRTITIVMDDRMRYTPSNIAVKQGETVRLIVRNKGQLQHELSLGTQQDLLAHLEQMKQLPGMAHDEPGKVTLGPGQRGEIVWQFTKSRTLFFACLIPGHYEAGMKGVIKVSLMDPRRATADFQL